MPRLQFPPPDTTGLPVVSGGCQVSPNYGAVRHSRPKTPDLMSFDVLWVPGSERARPARCFQPRRVTGAAGLPPTSAPATHRRALMARCC